MEFQAVVMAAGRGSRMTELTSCIAKPLLPVGNKPMIWYPVNMLEKAGFQEIIVAVFKSALDDVKRVLEEQHQVTVRIDYFTVDDHADADDAGTADTLRMMHDKIKADLLVVSCDFIVADAESGVQSLHQLADLYRKHSAAVAMLVVPAVNYTDGPVTCPGGKHRRRIEKDFIGLDKSGQRLLLLSADSDIDKLTVRISHLKRFPFIEVHTQLVDAHLYFINKSALDALSESSNIRTIKGDLIPHLVRRQFTDNKSSVTADDSKWECWTNSQYCMSWLRDADTMCCARLVTDSLYLRANTLLTYCEANRQAATESIVGAGVKVGVKTNIKNCVIGDNCELGAKVKLSSSVVMDHVSIEDGVNIIGCIICPNATISAGSELRDCLVGSGQSVAGKHSSELILERDHSVMEIHV